MKKITYCLVLLALFGCSQEPAKIVYKGDRVYSRGNVNGEKSTAYTNSPDGRLVRKLGHTPSQPQKAEPKKAPKVVLPKKTSIRNITVQRGDTLYGLAAKHNIPASKIAKENNLKSPFMLQPGQKLKLPYTGPRYHTVKSGENLYNISKKYDINLNSLVAANDIKEPYVIKSGQKLKLPTSVSSYSIEKVAKMEAKKQSIEKKKLRKNTRIASPASKNNSFAWPVKGSVISKFGPKKGGLHNDGINIAASEGQPFKATEDGVVAYVGNELRGYGNLIIVKHSSNWISAYAHCKDVVVERGEKIKKGSVLGHVGQSGNVKRSQLYFSLRKGRTSVNPEKYIK